MKYLNVSVTGLRGRHHPALSDQLTTLDVQKRPAIYEDATLLHTKNVPNNQVAPHIAAVAVSLVLAISDQLNLHATF